MAKPTVKDIKTFVEALKLSHKARQDLFADYDQLYWLDWELEEDVENVIVGTPHHEVNLACDIMASQDPKFEIPPRTEKKTDKDRADKIERWLYGLWYRTQKETRRNVVRDVTFWGVQRGWLVTKVLYDPKRLQRYQRENGDEPEDVARAKGKLPIIITSRDPETIYAEFSMDGGLVSVTEVYQRTVRDVKRAWPRFDLPLKEDADWEPNESIEWVEYWDEDYRCYLCGGKPVLPKGGVIKHNYGFIPYSIQFGRPIPTTKPEHMGLGLLFGVKDLVKSLNVLLTEIATAVTEVVSSPWAIYTTRPREFEVDLRRGAQNYFNPEDAERIEPIVRGPLPADVQYLMGLYQQYMDLGLFPHVMAGQPPGGVTAGYAISLLTHGGRIKLERAPSQGTPGLYRRDERDGAEAGGEHGQGATRYGRLHRD
jgi:hypothetical protein